MARERKSKTQKCHHRVKIEARSAEEGNMNPKGGNGLLRTIWLSPKKINILVGPFWNPKYVSVIA